MLWNYKIRKIEKEKIEKNRSKSCTPQEYLEENLKVQNYQKNCVRNKKK